MTTRFSSELLGPVAHIGLLVADLPGAMGTLAATGIQWSSVAEPEAVLRMPDGRVVRENVRYVAQSGGEPRLKMISGRPGGYFAPVLGDTALHHLSHWVDDLDATVCQLEAEGYRTEATGLEPYGEKARYVYLVAPGLVRVELGLRTNREEFDGWAG